MENIDFSILFVLGISIFGGLIGATLFQKLRIPQVVGYIVIGLIAGQSGLKVVSHDTVVKLQPFTLFALGIIGFLVGGELKGENFKKYARQFCAILFGEGLGAFILVGLGVGLFMYGAFHIGSVALASGLVFGAIASATDPASTIDVLWEYRSLGVLTTSLTAVVALDDALAMTLYGLGTGAATVLAGHSGTVLTEVGKVLLSLLGAVVGGSICAFIMKFLVKRIHQPEKCMAFAIGLILLLISIAVVLDIDVILTTMTLGCFLTNLLPKRSEELFKIVRSFSTPIYVLFFVLAGARLGISQMPSWLWWIVLIYVAGRTAGKFIGSYVGAQISGSTKEVRNFLGFGLFAQGGVAIGLSIMASHHLSGVMLKDNLPLGDVIIFGVAATTFIVQIIGPPMVKLAINLAGETGRNVTREDVLKSWKVRDAMDSDIVSIPEDMPLFKAAEIFMQNDSLVYPVVGAANSIIGVVSMQHFKDVLTHQDSWRWLLTSDVMSTFKEKVFAEAPLKDAMELMTEQNIDQVPVVEKENVPVGILDRSKVRTLIDKELIVRQQPETMKKYSRVAKKKERSMSGRMKLGKMNVNNIADLLVTDPAIVRAGDSVESIMAKIIDRPQTRHVYVVDSQDILIGTVSMNAIVEYLFPFEAMHENSNQEFINRFADFEAKTARDIMDPSPSVVKLNTPLGDMASMLMQQKVNELPVVDDDMRVVGQVNVYELIMSYRRQTKDRSPDTGAGGDNA